MKIKQGMTLFFRENDAFSNWYLRDFTVKGITFNCMEQYMMYSKAMLFGDKVTAQKILATTGPRCQQRQKNLGREVTPFNNAEWESKRERIVIAGLIAKFSQHKDLKELLLSTVGTILVEASPYDDIWGAKLGENDPRLFSLPPEQWPGKNLLGKCLTVARDFLLRRDKQLEMGSSNGISP
ncbi:MAG: NADAR family protein [Hafnia sp.]